MAAGVYRSYRAGELVLVRARVLMDCGSLWDGTIGQILIQDYPKTTMAVTTWAPLSELARFDDVARLLRDPIIDPASTAR